MGYSDLQVQFFNLFQLLGGYLNQDYTICGPTLDDAVTAYIKVSTADEIAATRAEIARFLELMADNLDAELERLTNGDLAREPGMPAREYLLWLDSLLAEGLADKDVIARDADRQSNRLPPARSVIG